VYAFGLALLVVVVWAVTGPIFDFSDTWQLVINTGTTIVTFLMVFLIQRSQNKDTQALHLKLNELIAAMRGASNRLIDAEDLSEDEVRRLHDRYRSLAERILQEADPARHHTVDEEERKKQGRRDGVKKPGAGNP
jgi:low affinity Fe/Cu permease